jgi:tetratricopeptide (TPR) repeat protein/SAM-dependent methyltransferase
LDPATDPDAEARHAAALHSEGRLDEAIELYRRALALRPDHFRAHFGLGSALHDRGELEEGIASYRRALALRPTARLLYNLGNALRQQGKLDDAIASYEQAIALKPAFAPAYNNLGTALIEQGRQQDAIAVFGRGIAQDAAAAFLHHNLGSALQQRGETDAAIESYRRAITLEPGAEIHRALGQLLQSQGRLEEAIASYRRAVALAPGYADAHGDLGEALQELQQPQESLACFQRALTLRDAPEFRAGFMRSIRRLDFTKGDAPLRHWVTRAVAEAWGRAGDLADVAARLIALDPEIRLARAQAASAWPTRLPLAVLFGGRGLGPIVREPLLRALLESCPVCDLALERLLATLRLGLLEAAAGGAPPGDALEFHCALARQCFINEYVYSITPEEALAAGALRARLDAALASGADVPPAWVAAVASYFPLEALSRREALRERKWPECVQALVRQQVTEPLEEHALRATTPALTPIGEGVSSQVRQQYEENPYPRWLGLPHPGPAVSVAAYLRRHFPFAAFQPLDEGAGVDILVAGCGTGREPIDVARQFVGARVLAVDLSLASLSYAKRKARELGVANIDFAQADIMNIASIGRSFDLISSVGVLHHLADPAAGWKELLKLLRPGGLMLTGLYSEHARGDATRVVAARKFIEERGYAPTVGGIRACREALMAAGDAFLPLTTFADFFTVSECRDLIFHVQEHRFSLPQIERLLETLGLAFVAFSLEPGVTDVYRARFPDDRNLADLGHWHQLELTAGAGPFVGMYTFWTQKRR